MTGSYDSPTGAFYRAEVKARFLRAVFEVDPNVLREILCCENQEKVAAWAKAKNLNAPWFVRWAWRLTEDSLVARMARMGEVYRARDTRLKREVAIKILPEAFASGPRTARTPNIAPQWPMTASTRLDAASDDDEALSALRSVYNSAHNMTLWFYTFPDLARFKESALGAPEHIAIHTKVLNGLKAGQLPLPAYNFHATNDAHADIQAIRAELREMYRTIFIESGKLEARHATPV